MSTEYSKEPKVSKTLTQTLSRIKGGLKKEDGNVSTFSRVSHDLSKINYLKTSSLFESDVLSQSQNISSCISEDASHALYDRLADKFYGVPNFNRDLHWTNVHLAGSWGSHAYEYSAWDDGERPTVKLVSYNNLELTEDEEDGILSDRVIAACSSYLDRAPETEEYVLCKCILANKGIYVISALKKYHYIQYLDLSKNRLTTLEALGEMPFLMYLDASSNMLTEVLDFKAPFNLMYANLSSNEIRTIRDLSDFWSLIVLDLSHNEIEVISGLCKLKHLRGLNLSYNWISTLEGLSHLDRVQCLSLYNNIISKFEIGPDVGFKTMSRLKKMSLARNIINSLQIVEGARYLQMLDISDNRIEDVVELVYLKDLNRLYELDMRENPIRYHNRYFDTTVNYCKSLFILDDEEINAEVKVLSRKKFEMSIYEFVKPGTQHILLNSFNFPNISKSVIPYSDPPRPMIVLVGPPSCLKGLLVDLCCEIFPQYVSRGVNHTTRPRSEGEIDGEQYHFVTYETFKDMMRRGLFYTTSEYFGHLYGFAQSEMSKVTSKKSVLILHTDLNGALLLRARGLRPTLVLTIPKSEEMHRKYLLRKYYCHSLQTGILEVGVSRTKAYEGLIRMKKYTHRHVVRGVKKMLGDLFRDVKSESFDGKIDNPDITITGGMTLRKLIDGTCEDLSDILSPTNEEADSTRREAEYWFMMMGHETDEKIFCFKDLSDKQKEAMKNLGINQIVQDYLLHNGKFADEDEYMNDVASGDFLKGDSSVVLKEISNLHKLFNDVMASRKAYLEMHWANPGLFAQVRNRG
ncbi:leucine-rich repeat and guanylate kinase domain-containing protein-like isoform X2 [Coccinella septempunctata]|uniref:leucine-rich repeat and guanylate kinase domain-containing protein-like isoform X2 n=1 Tax=Coccinella septempunctata TaxID=41139 RepID=UPI001D06384D|nr:leucine-rich repeat and guanylate kinase domain-containing protein-like isoform X2 [Coccinella septempunctata]